jgi:diguanylate cyclase (GGDEF)-like protein
MVTEPSLAVELLRAACSVARRGKPVLDLDWCCELLGDEALFQRALTLTTPEGSDGLGSVEPACGGAALRRHLVATASAARGLASALGARRPNEAYTLGLLHATGLLALLALRPEGLDELCARTAGLTPAECSAVERAVFGLDRREAGLALARAWQLPPELCDVIAFLEAGSEELDRDCAPSSIELVGVVRAAVHVAGCAGFPWIEGARRGPRSEDVATLLEAADVEGLVIACKQAVADADEALLPRSDDVVEWLNSLRAAKRRVTEIFHRTERRRKAAEAVNEVLQYGLGRLGDGDPLPGVFLSTMQSIDFRRMAHLQVDPEQGTLTVRTCLVRGRARRVPEGTVIDFPVVPGEEPFGEAQVLLEGDGNDAGQRLRELFGVTACVVAPLVSRDGTPGDYLLADHAQTGAIPVEEEARSLGIIAKQARLLLEYEELSRQTERMASQDPLTGAATRRRLMDRLDFLIAQGDRTRLPLSLAILDLDHFKKFNDTLGHQTGDKLLVSLVEVLQRNTRQTDLVARFGGEEFVVVLPNCELAAAHRVADTLRVAIYEYGLDHAEEYGGLPISISVGVAQARPGESSNDVIGRADAALYRAKHNGRNRVERAGQEAA